MWGYTFWDKGMGEAFVELQVWRMKELEYKCARIFVWRYRGGNTGVGDAYLGVQV